MRVLRPITTPLLTLIPQLRSGLQRCTALSASLESIVAEDVSCIQKEKFQTAKFELHQLLGQPSLKGVPLLVVSMHYTDYTLTTYCETQLGNKNDIEGHATVNELIKALSVALAVRASSGQIY